MDAKRYGRVGHATVPRSMFDVGACDPVDLLACSLWVHLDALGAHEAKVETWRRNRPARTWTFDDTSNHLRIAQLLKEGPSASLPDAEAPDALVRWVESTAETAGLPGTTAAVELTAHHRDGSVALELTYTGLDRDVAADVLANVLAGIVSEVAADPERSAARIPLVSPGQRTWLVDELNAVRMDYPDAPTVDALVREVAARAPDAVAVVDAHDAVTYAALLDRACAVAETLRTAGARPGEAIGVMFPRGIHCVAAMLGVLVAGAVYVPVPLEDPEPRRERLLDLVSVRLLLQAGDGESGIELARRDAAGLVVPGYSTDDRGSSPLYVMFTSGSTGEPKAVVVPHRSVIRLVRDPWFVGISSDDGVGFASNPGFDAASWEVWGALCNGARLVAVDPAIVAQPDQLEVLIRSQRVTCLFLTTSLFNLHARTAPATFGNLRVLGIGGEAADPHMCRRVLESDSPPGSLVNAYGPTESATFASWHEIVHVPDGALRLPIGRPIVNTTLHVLDRHGRPLPPGIAGELFIGGDGLALGYLNDAELTARKFVPDPFAGPPHRLYATGDLVVREADGVVVFIGRLDDQLKIRGFRVEPREVESAIRAISGVSAAVVVARVVDGYTRLVAYVITETAGSEPAAIRARLRAELPDYLVPSHVALVDELPLTKSGKLDRARLPDPFASGPLAARATSDGADDAHNPDDRVAASIADIWREVLGLEIIDPDESFFDAGGDSLLAVRLFGAVQRRFGVVLPGGVVSQELTIGSFAEAVREALGRAAPPIVIELSATEGPPVVLVGGGGGELYGYRWLVRALANRFHLVGVREPGHYGTEPRRRSIADVSEAWARALREAGVEWPVAVIGGCSGGILAHQLACDLTRDGHGPDLVALLETPVPGAGGPDAPAGGARRRLVGTVRRRGRNAIALARMQVHWTWCRVRHVPAPPALAHSMTLRTNARRLLHARPSYFSGRLLYVQAVDADGMTETAGAPEYWTRLVASAEIVKAPGSHIGAESFLSRSQVGVTADALARELAAVCGTGVA